MLLPANTSADSASVLNRRFNRTRCSQGVAIARRCTDRAGAGSTCQCKFATKAWPITRRGEACRLLTSTPSDSAAQTLVSRQQ